MRSRVALVLGVASAGAVGCTELLGADWDGRPADAPQDGAAAAPDEDGGGGDAGADVSLRRDAEADASRAAPTPLGLGAFHSCATDVGGRLLCWGEDSLGQSGAPITGFLASAVVVAMPEKGSSAAAGWDFSCVLGASGDVFTWGSNMSGQLGRSLPPPKGADHVPGKVVGLTEPSVGLAARSTHACVALASGKVACWGDGFSATGSGDRPALVAGLAGAARGIAVGYAHGCALLDGGGVQCWGKNDQRQLGVDTTEATTLPVTVPFVGRAVAVVAGATHTCALRDDGSVDCWGANGSGQLGTAAAGLTRSAAPVTVAGVTGASMLTAGDEHTCAATPAGRITCWGSAADGRLGGDPTSPGAVVEVFGLPAGVDAVGAGRDHTCARVGAGGTFCWGDNARGQLGNGDTMNKKKGPAPRAVENW